MCSRNAVTALTKAHAMTFENSMTLTDKGVTSRPAAVHPAKVVSMTSPLTNLGAPSSPAFRLASSVPWRGQRHFQPT